MTKTEALRHEIYEWVKKNRLGPDVFFYSAADWQKRGEEYGNTAPLTVTFEGTLNHVLNYPRSEEDVRLYREFMEEIPERHGFYVEQGYAWSAHFYQTEGKERE